MTSTVDPFLAEVGEQGTIAAIQSIAACSLNGDDAAVLHDAAPNSKSVLTTDMLVESRHFRLDWSTPYQLGRKAIVQNFADIQAMGARPLAVVVALSLPPERTRLSFITGLAQGMAQELEAYSAELVGGDVTAGDQIVVSVSAIGSLVGNLPPLTLGGAQPGQHVIAHGAIGYSMAGYEILRHCGHTYPEHFEPLVAAHLTPTVQPERGVIARATGATAMTDNSDGLYVDLSTLAKHSGVGIDLTREALAPDSLLEEAGEFLGVDPWRWILTGGEDHTLLATTRTQKTSGFRKIGTVTEGTEVTVNGATPHYNTGWASF